MYQKRPTSIIKRLCLLWFMYHTIDYQNTVEDQSQYARCGFCGKGVRMDKGFKHFSWGYFCDVSCYNNMLSAIQQEEEDAYDNQ